MPKLVRTGNTEASLLPSCPQGGEQLQVAWRTCPLPSLEAKENGINVVKHPYRGVISKEHIVKN